MHAYHPGQQLTDAWNQYPLHPQPVIQLLTGRLAQQQPQSPSAYRAGDRLWLSFKPFADNQPGHVGSGFNASGAHVSGSYAIDQDGKQIARGNAVKGIPPVTLSRHPSRIRFALSGARRSRQYQLSLAFRTVWNWRSRPRAAAKVPTSWICGGTSRHCAVQPLMTLDYHVHRMSLRGSTEAGRQIIGLTVGHLQLGGHAAITSATVRVSFDGGRTWHQAHMTRNAAGQFTAAFTAPARATVTLRTRATDAAGGSVTETIQDAYRVS